MSVCECVYVFVWKILFESKRTQINKKFDYFIHLNNTNLAVYTKEDPNNNTILC